MKKEILIIDDDRDIVSVLTAILEEYKYAVRAVYNGTDALTLIKTFRPDLILLDYMLPDMNGDEVADAVRDMLKEKTMPIILISAAHNGKKVAEQAKMDGYISKPFEMEHLLETVKSFIGP
jgi:CheY-like chemotaxis protein